MGLSDTVQSFELLLFYHFGRVLFCLFEETLLRITEVFSLPENLLEFETRRNGKRKLKLLSPTVTCGLLVLHADEYLQRTIRI